MIGEVSVKLNYRSSEIGRKMDDSKYPFINGLFSR